MMIYMLATKSGWLIPVKPASQKNTWNAATGKDVFYVPPSRMKTMRVFSGDNSIDEAIEWINGGTK